MREAKKIYKREEVPVGAFVSTSACRSKNHQFILHCVCPEWDSDDSEEVLKNLIISVLEFSDKNKVESISVPPMSSGILGFPLKN